MSNRTANEGWEKRIWEKRIKETMVPVSGSKSVYRLNDKKAKSVEIHFGTRNPTTPSRRYGQPPKIQPAVGQGNVTLDVSSADFLIVNKHPAIMKCTQYIPWKKIVEIVFPEA
jgi:hypothetical protein